MDNAWRAGPECPPHHRDALERAVNCLPKDWLVEPTNGEVFNCKEDCERRLRGFALSAGFDIVRTGGGTKTAPAQQWHCIHHGARTRNYRKLEEQVERDNTGSIQSNRKRDSTQVDQLDCPWRARLSWKSVGVRGDSSKSWILAVWPGHSHPLVDDALVYTAHLSTLPEYRQLTQQATTHRQASITYRESRRITNINDPSIGVKLTSKQYYNLVRGKFDKADPATYSALVQALQDANFIYETRVESTHAENTSEPIRRMSQVWFSHPQLLSLAARFVSGSYLSIDGTFNINELQ